MRFSSSAMDFPMLVRTLESRKPLRDRLFVLILVVTAIAMGAQVVYRHLATQQATATVADVRPYCEKVSCSWGKCNTRTHINCEEADRLESTDMHIQRSWSGQSAFIARDQEAKLIFLGRDGNERTTWVTFERLGIASARIGDSRSIHYIDGSSPEVVNQPSLYLSIVGIIVLLVMVKFGIGMAQRSAGSQGVGTAV